MRVLLGPTPENPEYVAYWSKEVHQPGMKEPYVPSSPEGKAEGEDREETRREEVSGIGERPSTDAETFLVQTRREVSQGRGGDRVLRAVRGHE